MAKKDTVFIDIQTSDGGSMQRVAVSAKKLGVALDDVGVATTKTGKGARNADRNLKGLSKQSSNTTKNFSKMAQGMTGGLVPAYAILASNVFAITAAFQFLKQAADFRVIQDSQVAFTGATGVGMRTLTADIQEASGAMLTFQAASEAAAIGIASGLGSGQITELAEGAGNLSKILGRDVTDSFNRLVRGVTKAEPELLDELGITLRLADASEAYAATLGKTAQDLTKFEKKQAVFLDVQTQLEKKYNQVARATDVQANSIARLGVAFDRVMKHVKSFTATIGEPVAEFFTKNIESLAAALALLAIPILKSIIPGLNTFAATSRESADEAAAAFERSRKELEKLERQADKIAAKGDPLKAAQGALLGKTGQGTTGGGATADALRSGNTPERRQIAAALRFAKEGKGVVEQMSKKQARAYKASLRAMLKDAKNFGDRAAIEFEKAENAAARSAQGMKVKWKSALASMQSATAKFAKGVDLIFKAVGFVGLLLMLKDIGVQLLEMMNIIKSSKGFEGLQEQAKNLAAGFKDLNKEFSTFAGTQKTIGSNTLAGFKAMGLMVEQTSNKMIEAAEALNTFADKDAAMQAAGISEFTKEHEDEIKALEQKAKTNTRFIKTYDELQEAIKAQTLQITQMGQIERAQQLARGKQLKEGTQAYKDFMNEQLQMGGALQGLMSTGLGLEDKNTLKALKTLEKEYNDFQALFAKGLDTTALQAGLKSTLDQQIEIFEKAKKNTGSLTDEQQKYLDVLTAVRNQGGPITEADIKAIKDAAASLVNLGAVAGTIQEQTTATNLRYQETVNALGQYKTSVSDLISEIETLRDEENNLQTKGYAARVKTLEDQLKVLESIGALEIDFANRKRRAEAKFIRQKQGATKLQLEEINRSEKILGNNIEIQKIEETFRLAKLGNLEIDERRREELNSQLDILNAQNESLERQRDMSLQIRDAGMQGLESGLQSQISAVLKGEEKSLKDALLGVVKSITDSMIDALSKSLTEKIMVKFIKGFETTEMKQKKAVREGVEEGADTLAEDFETSVDSATQKMATALDEAALRFADAIRDACSHCCMGSGSGDAPGPRPPTTTPEFVAEVNRPDVISEAAVNAERQAKAAGDAADNLEKVAEETGEGGGFSNFFKRLGEGLFGTKEEIPLSGDEKVIGTTNLGTDVVQDPGTKRVGGLFKNFTKNFGAIFEKNTEAGLGAKLGTLFKGLGTDLGGIFNTFKDGLGSLFSGMMGGGSNILGTVFSFLGFGRSGIYPPMGYATGGIARGSQAGYPAVLHGSEAVVPLPDGKSIPVTMPKGSGGGMQNNNVGVTINIDNQGQASADTDSDSQQAAILGERIAEVVKEELLNQKRNGGILSPFGVA